MPNLIETSTYEAGVYQLETSDPALGGSGGVLNTPLRQLANRTTYLKNGLDAAAADIENATATAGSAVTTAQSSNNVAQSALTLAQAVDDFTGAVAYRNVTTHPSVVFNNSTPVTDRHVATPAATSGFNLTSGRMDVAFDFTSTNYFTQNPGGHFAVVLRCDTDLIETQVRGQGVAIGHIAGAYEAAAHYPLVQAETWFAGVGPASPPQRFLIPGTETLPSKTLVDGVPYRFIISSIVQPNGNRYIRYVLYKWNTTVSAWDCERDTGDVLDQNPWLDVTKTGLVFAHVFENGAAAPWSVEISNISTTWGPAGTPVTQVPTWQLGAAEAAGGALSGTTLTLTGAATGTTLNLSGAATATTYMVTGATNAIGASTGFTGPNNTNAASVTAWRTSAQDFNVYATAGNIAAYAGSGVETVLRPLYGIVGNMIQLLREKKIL